MYWRIPGNLTTQDLRKTLVVINQALDGSLIAQDNGEYQYMISYNSEHTTNAEEL
jgi:hypothetical protein